MSTTEEEYNGWRNVETWRVQLHLANDPQTATTICQVAEEFANESTGGDGLSERDGLAEWLSTFVETRALLDAEAMAKVAEDTGHDNWGQFSNDSMRHALSRVDWVQIADHWMEWGHVYGRRGPVR